MLGFPMLNSIGGGLLRDIVQVCGDCIIMNKDRDLTPEKAGDVEETLHLDSQFL